VQDTEDCLKGDQLKDLGAYFAPSLEGVQADCKSTRQPSSGARRFTAALRIESRSQTESALVQADVEGIWTGACKAPPAPPAEPAP
jgi:hypothetical protein